MPSYPCASQRRFNRRMWRGEYPKMSAACSHVSRPSIAFTITSFAVIALASRATAASIRIATTYPARRTSLSAYDADIFSALYTATRFRCAEGWSLLGTAMGSPDHVGELIRQLALWS